MNNKKLVINAPCYNEEEIIEYSIAQLSKLLNLLISENLISDNSQICYINDGSTDNTRQIIEKYCAKNNHIALINFYSQLWSAVCSVSRFKRNLCRYDYKHRLRFTG
ncbi:MAG: glycosyltransferase [Candidatus Melainabacteria bacterium]|nr:MAG: glycosyltransferase [Candidatus Melainabacteria bacterium]